MLQVYLKYIYIFAGNFCNVRDFKFRGLTSQSYTTEYMLVPLVDQFIEQTRKLNEPMKKSESFNAQLLEANYYFIINLYIVLNHISVCIRY